MQPHLIDAAMEILSATYPTELVAVTVELHVPLECARYTARVGSNVCDRPTQPKDVYGFGSTAAGAVSDVIRRAGVRARASAPVVSPTFFVPPAIQTRINP